MDATHATLTCPRCGAVTDADASFCGRCGAAVTATHRATDGDIGLLRQATAGEYEIVGEVGRGGMATVYLARDLSLDRNVAIKLLLPDPRGGRQHGERFKQRRCGSGRCGSPRRPAASGR